jgi:hypothetical protein
LGFTHYQLSRVALLRHCSAFRALIRRGAKIVAALLTMSCRNLNATPKPNDWDNRLERVAGHCTRHLSVAATEAASELLNVSILPIRFVAHPCLPRSQGQLIVYTDLQHALAKHQKPVGFCDRTQITQLSSLQNQLIKNPALRKIFVDGSRSNSYTHFP